MTAEPTQPIYLDNNATTAIDPLVVRAMVDVWSQGPLNPSSQHRSGRRARSMLDTACVRIANSLGADIEITGGDQLLLTSGGTESNFWALKSLADPELDRWISAIEHPSLLMPAKRMASEGSKIHFIPVDSEGRISPQVLDRLLGQSRSSNKLVHAKDFPRGLVSIMAANNETGVLQDLVHLAEVCHAHGMLFHTDATQWIGKIPFNLAELGVDAVSFAAHKFHGPCGVGGLLLRTGVKIRPVYEGGQQQLGLRAGTESVGLVVGMAKALELALSEMPQTTEKMCGLRQRFEDSLLDLIPGSVLHSVAASRLPGTSCIAFPGTDRQTLLLLLDRAGVACSTGSACSSGSSEPSHVLQAMGISAALIESSLRFGLSRFSTEADVDQAIDRIVNCVNKLRNRSVVEKGVKKSFDS